MTPLEHAMLGVNAALALGLHRRHGWKIAAMAGLAAAAPDWDGLTLLAGPSLYDRGHRAWGHNVFACVLFGVVLGLADYRFDLVTRLGRRIVRQVRLEAPQEQLRPRTNYNVRGAVVWSLVAILAGLSHLAADLFISGSSVYRDWGLQLFWPLTDRSWVYPRVQWGDVGITLIFAAGAFLMLWRPRRVQLIAALTLAAVATYIAVRPWL